MEATAEGLVADSSEEREEAGRVFALIDHERTGAISEAALAQALLSTQLCSESQARMVAADASREGRLIDAMAFFAAVEQLVEDMARAQLESSSGMKRSKPAAPTIGAALRGILEDLQKFYATQRSDFRTALDAKEALALVTRREENRRIRRITMRQESEHQGVQEAQMMQAMEFNSAWSQNMTEFERQAREIEEGAIRRHQEEFAAYRQKLYNREPHSYKFSRELLHLKNAVEAHARQGNYDQAHGIKKRADQLEKWERLKLDNEHKTYVATKELQLRQQQQSQLEALRRRIQRGREEHKEHWLMGAQRLMQSHRNMLSDLKSKQALENLRADVAVKLDMQSGNAEATVSKIKNHFRDTLPRVDTGKNIKPGTASRRALGATA